MTELTDAAKEEIRTGIRIVREDKFEAFVRSRTAPSQDPPKDPKPPKDPVTPPPAKDPKDPEPTPEPTSGNEHSRYWGEILRD